METWPVDRCPPASLFLLLENLPTGPQEFLQSRVKKSQSRRQFAQPRVERRAIPLEAHHHRRCFRNIYENLCRYSPRVLVAYTRSTWMHVSRYFRKKRRGQRWKRRNKRCDTFARLARRRIERTNRKPNQIRLPSNRACCQTIGAAPFRSLD